MATIHQTELDSGKHFESQHVHILHKRVFNQELAPLFGHWDNLEY